MNIREKILKLKKDENISITELARKSGISYVSIYKWVADPSIKPFKCSTDKIVKAFNLPRDYFDNLDPVEPTVKKKATKKKVFELFEDEDDSKSYEWFVKQTGWKYKELKTAYDEYLKIRRLQNEKR